VDPRILQIVAKNTPGELERISIPDGMNVHGKIHIAEKPKALLALKHAKEEKKRKAEEAARQQRKREALAALNRTVNHLNLHQKSGEISVQAKILKSPPYGDLFYGICSRALTFQNPIWGQEWMSDEGSRDLNSPAERPGVTLLLHRSRSPERGGADAFARTGVTADFPSGKQGPAAAQVVRKAGRKYHDLPEASACSEWGTSAVHIPTKKKSTFYTDFI
jgi:hypothetical protein